jgi:hypothetical protein
MSKQPDLFDKRKKPKPKRRPRGKPAWAVDKKALKVIADARKKGVFT